MCIHQFCSLYPFPLQHTWPRGPKFSRSTSRRKSSAAPVLGTRAKRLISSWPGRFSTSLCGTVGCPAKKWMDHRLRENVWLLVVVNGVSCVFMILNCCLPQNSKIAWIFRARSILGWMEGSLNFGMDGSGDVLWLCQLWLLHKTRPRSQCAVTMWVDCSLLLHDSTQAWPENQVFELST